MARVEIADGMKLHSDSLMPGNKGKMDSRVILEHPEYVHLLWGLFHVFPLGLSPAVDIAALLGRGDLQKRTEYLRLSAIRRILGDSGVDYVIDHLATGLTREGLNKLYPLNPPTMQQKIAGIWGDKSPLIGLDRPSLTALLSPPSSKTPLLLTSGSGDLPDQIELYSPPGGLEPGSDAALRERLLALIETRAIFLDNGRRVKKTDNRPPEDVRAEHLRFLTEHFAGLAARSIHPVLSCSEAVAIFDWVRDSYPKEQAGIVLAEMVRFYSAVVRGFMAFISKEEGRDHLYPDQWEFSSQTENLRERVVQAAWGLVSLARRTSYAEVYRAAAEEIPLIKISLKEMKRKAANEMSLVTVSLEEMKRKEETQKVVANASNILSVLSRKYLPDLPYGFPEVTRVWLRDKFGASITADVYQITGDENGEITVRLDDGLTMPDDFSVFTWFALMFPFHQAINIRQKNGKGIVLDAVKVRQHLMEEYPEDPRHFYAEEVEARLATNGLQLVETK